MKAIFKRFTRMDSKEEKKIVETSTPPSNPFPLADLPDLVILCIASKLKTNDARNLSFTCKRFKVIFKRQPRAFSDRFSLSLSTIKPNIFSYPDLITYINIKYN